MSVHVTLTWDMKAILAEHALPTKTAHLDTRCPPQHQQNLTDQPRQHCNPLG